MRLLSEIAKELRKTTTEEKIVAGIKNREISEIEENGYTTQQNYPNGVYVYAQNEDIDGVLFGSRSHGGAREGSGAPHKPEWLKKKQIGLTLPRWIIGKLDELPKSRAVEIEKALVEKFGWNPPN